MKAWRPGCVVFIDTTQSLKYDHAIRYEVFSERLNKPQSQFAKLHLTSAIYVNGFLETMMAKDIDDNNWR